MPVTKFYLTTQAATFTPTSYRGAWNDSAGAVTRLLDSVKNTGGNVTSVARAEAVTTSPYNVCLYRGVSGPLAAGATGVQNLNVVIGVTEGPDASANFHWRIHAYITAGDTDTVRGTLLTNYGEAAGTNEWGTSATTSGKALNAAQALASVTAVAGDRLVVEIGYAARNTVTTNYTGTLWYGTQVSGDVVADLAASGNGQVLAGFITFSTGLNEDLTDVEARLTQAVAEAVHAPTPAGRLSQAVVEVLYTPTVDAPGLHFAHGLFKWGSADAVGTTYALDCVDFTPRAIRIWSLGVPNITDTVTAGQDGRRGQGFATSATSRVCVASRDNDGITTSQCASGWRDDAVLTVMTLTPGFVGRLDVQSFGLTAVVLINDESPGTDVAVCWEAWGGNDVLEAAVGSFPEPAAAGTQTYSPPGMTGTPSVLLLAGVQATAAAGTAQRRASGFMAGFASGSAVGENVVLVGNAADAAGVSDTASYTRAGECLAMTATSGVSISGRAALDSFSAGQFALNWLEAGVADRRYVYLAVCGGGWRAGSYTLDVSTAGNTTTVSGLPFAPAGLLLIGTAGSPFTTDTGSAGDRFNLGVGGSPTDRRTMGHLSRDSSDPTEIVLTAQYDQVYAWPTAAGALNVACDIDAMLSDGFRVVVDQTSSSSTDEWQGYLTFGTEVGGETHERTFSDSLALADTFARQLQSLRTLPDSLAFGDAPTRAVAFGRAAAESQGLTDALLRRQVAFRLAEDSLALADAAALLLVGGAVITRQVAESLGLAEAYRRLSLSRREIADSLALGDQPRRGRAVARGVSEFAALAEEYRRLAPALRLLPDSLGLAEAYRRLADALRLLPDSLALAEAVALALIGEGVIPCQVRDSLALADAPGRQSQALRRFPDFLGLADAVLLTLIGGGILPRLVSDPLGVEEAVNRVSDALRAVPDLAGLEDALSSALARGLRPVPDTLGLSEALRRVVTYAKALEDSAGLVEEVARRSPARRVVAESLAVAEWVRLLLLEAAGPPPGFVFLEPFRGLRFVEAARSLVFQEARRTRFTEPGRAARFTETRRRTFTEPSRGLVFTERD